jgi:hypothetical protein
LFDMARDESLGAQPPTPQQKQAEIDASMTAEAATASLLEIFDHFVGYAPGCAIVPCYPCARHKAYAARGRALIAELTEARGK